MTEIRAALGILQRRKRVLLQRLAAVHHERCWSFPGGELEPGEEPARALSRILLEELGLETRQVSPFIKVCWRYPRHKVHLSVFTVNANSETLPAGGTASGNAKWWRLEELPEMPPANGAILNAMKLPPVMAVTPLLKAGATAEFLKTVEPCLRRGLKLIYLRGLGIPRRHYLKLLRTLQDMCLQHGAIVLRDTRHGIVANQALHLATGHQRPAMASCNWRCASCHNKREADAAKAKGANILLTSPVLRTASHPQRRALGWERFQRIADGCSLPCYALGGMECGHLHRAKQHGARGIALHSKLWQAPAPDKVIADCVRIAKEYGDIYPI